VSKTVKVRILPRRFWRRAVDSSFRVDGKPIMYCLYRGKLGRIRIGEETAWKAVAMKVVGGSSPPLSVVVRWSVMLLLSAKNILADDGRAVGNGAPCSFAKRVVFFDLEVQLLSLPLLCQPASADFAERALDFNPGVSQMGSIRIGEEAASKTAAG
jgi:hypothetical protein